MPDYYMVMSDNASPDVNGTATGTGGKYSAAEYAAIGADGFANALSNNWGTKGHSTLPEYYYAEIVDAVTAGAGAGDYILCADTHSFTESGGTGYKDILGPTSGTLLNIISVDVTDITTHKAGAFEAFDGGDGWSHEGCTNHVGVDYSTDGHLVFSSWGAMNAYSDCTITLTHATVGHAAPYGYWDGVGTILNNVDIDGSASVGHALSNHGGTTTVWNGGSVIGARTNLTSGWTQGGGSLKITGVDLSAIGTRLLNTVGGNRADDDAGEIVLRNCKLHASVITNNEDLESLNQRIRMYNCGATAAEQEYAYHEVAFGGEAEDETTVYRDESGAFPSGTKTSTKVVTVGNVSRGTPFRFNLLTRYMDLTAYSIVRVYFCSTTALTQELSNGELIYRKASPNQHEPVRLSNAPADFLASGTACTTDSSSTWIDTTASPQAFTGNKYQMDFDTSGVPGCAGTFELYLNFGEAAATEIFVCTSLGLIV